jgi:hypothetical protein
MLNDLALLEEKDGWERKPYIIWWPLKPNETFLEMLAEHVPGMKREIAAAAIACNYVSLYKFLDPEPSWHLWVIGDEFSQNPFFREDQERRAKEKGVEIENGWYEDIAYPELAKTREVTIIDERDEHETIRDCVEKRQIRGRYEKILDTNLVQRKAWHGVGKVSQDMNLVR